MRDSKEDDVEKVNGCLSQNEKGATSIEYALIVSLIFLAIVTAASNVALKTNDMWNHVANSVNKD